MNDTSIKIFISALMGMAFITILHLCNQVGYIKANNEFYQSCLKLSAYVYQDKKITCSIE